MVQYIIIAALLTGSIGLMLLVIGSIFTAVVALGNKQHIFGWSVFLCFPLSLVYCAMNWDKSSYSGKMVYTGAALLALTAIILKFGGII
ncbi:MAG: hypothetical protein HRT54_18680 [Colwellia sp.]|nr:hypothetical protein [Colwellia sp.]